MHGLVHDNFKTWTGTFGKLTDPQIDKLDTSEQQGQVGGWRRPTRLSERASERERERERGRRERGGKEVIFILVFIFVFMSIRIFMLCLMLVYICGLYT